MIHEIYDNGAMRTTLTSTHESFISFQNCSSCKGSGMVLNKDKKLVQCSRCLNKFNPVPIWETIIKEILTSLSDYVKLCGEHGLKINEEKFRSHHRVKLYKLLDSKIENHVEPKIVSILENTHDSIKNV